MQEAMPTITGASHLSLDSRELIDVAGKAYADTALGLGRLLGGEES